MTTALHRPTDPRTAARRMAVQSSFAGVAGGGFRADVEGLRALAVIAVVLFHAEVAGFAGGFVGVDVFFVVSGFLITQLLLREFESSGTISLHDFWARRARRLLPASCLVLVVTLVAARFMMAPALLGDVGRDAIAAGLFVVNFVFAERLGDYFGAQLGETTPSPLLHFWSLAVEEQFYLLWPGLLVVLARLTPRPASLRRQLAVVMVVIAIASFVASVWMTDNQPTRAFYLLPARAVELLAGAAVALTGTALREVDARLRAVVGWVGVAGIVTAVLTYDESIAFPGTATMLPVLSTLLVVASGGFEPSRFAPVAVLGREPLLWIGRHSYAIYLWHWPALVLAEAQWGPLSVGQRMIAVAVSLVLAVGSRWLVEEPVRHSRGLTRYPGRSVVMGVGLAIVAVLAGTATIAFQPRLDSGTIASAPELELAEPSAVDVPSDGAADGVTPQSTTTVAPEPDVVPTAEQLVGVLIAANRVVLEEALLADDVPGNLRPSVASVYEDRPQVYGDGCVNIGVDDTLRDCRYGVEGASTTVVLYGDSHAAQWAPALEAIAIDNGFELIVLAKGGCPTADVRIATNTLGRTCPAWRDRVVQFIAAERPTMVIVTAWAEYDNDDDEWQRGLDTTLGRIAGSTDHLVVLADSPDASANPQVCLSSNPRSMTSCTNRRERAVEPGRLAAEEAVAAAYGAAFVPTADWFCTDVRCPMVLGDVLLYRDADHITTLGALWFQRLLEASIMPILDAGWLDTQGVPGNLIRALDG